MQIKEKYIRPAVEDERTVKVVCDLCKAEGHYGQWNNSWYEINDTTINMEIRQREGNQYPEGGSSTEVVIDLCPKCFKDRLIPWLQSQGAEIKSLDYDW